MSHKIDLLIPLEAMPGEGADVSAFEGSTGNTSHSDLVSYYLELTADSPLVFKISDQGVTGNTHQMAFPLQHGRLRHEEKQESPLWIDLSPSQTTLDLAELLSDETGDELGLGDGETPEEYLKSFLDHFKTKLSFASRGFSGTAIPLLRWSKNGSDTDILVQFCGVILADEELLTSLWGADGDGKSSGTGIKFNGSLGLVLEEAEIEARGIREIAASLAVMGIVAAAAPSAEAGILDDLFGNNKSGDKRSSGWPNTEQIQRVNHRQAPARIDQNLLAHARSAPTDIIVDVQNQRAYVLVNGQIAIDTPVSTARAGKHTPRGEFKITQRVRTGKTSTIYGCDLPYWMRLDQSAIGMHVGDLPGYPASAGCIRLPVNIAPYVFDATQSGTTVKVVDSWQPTTMVASTTVAAAPSAQG